MRAEWARDSSDEAARVSTRQFVVREGPESPELSLEDRFKAFESETRYTLAEIRHDLLMLRRDVAGMREQMATRPEVEALHDDIRMVAEGFAQTQQRLQETADLLRRFLTSTRT
jgi:hypothetical protein